MKPSLYTDAPLLFLFMLFSLPSTLRRDRTSKMWTWAMWGVCVGLCSMDPGCQRCKSQLIQYIHEIWTCTVRDLHSIVLLLCMMPWLVERWTRGACNDSVGTKTPDLEWRELEGRCRRLLIELLLQLHILLQHYNTKETCKCERPCSNWISLQSEILK